VSGETTKLCKVMMLTTSDNDSEALAALRKANALLKQRGLNWEDIFAALTEAAASDEDEDDSEDYEAARIRAALAVAMRSAGSESFRDFLDSIAEQFAEKGFLSPKQRAAVFKSARRAGWQG
jgi:hypothetical protein